MLMKAYPNLIPSTPNPNAEPELVRLSTAKSSQEKLLNQLVSNKHITTFFLLVFIFSKIVLESLYTQVPILLTSPHWYGQSLRMVSLWYFVAILASKLF